MTDAHVEEWHTGVKCNISYYEETYKMTSEEMLNLLNKGEIEETIEIFEWKLYFGELQMLEREILTTGKPTRTTEPSITND